MSSPSPDVPEPSIPKPNIPTPDIPKPNIPAPDIPAPTIPAPNLDRPASETPISAAVTGATEAPAPQPKDDFDDEPTTIEYSETLLPQRILAGVIDVLVAGVLMGIFSAILPDALGLLSNVVFIAAILFKDSLPFLDGQSVGKKVAKIQAVTLDGKPLTTDLKAGVVRNIFAAILPLAIVEVIVLNSREKAPNTGLRLGDDFAKTKVISVKESLPDSEEE